MVTTAINGTHCSIGDQKISCSLLSFRELSFGSDASPLRVEPYSILVERGEFLNKFRSIYDEWIEDQKADDLKTGNPSPSYFHDLGYPSLEAFMNHPDEFQDLIKCYLPLDTLAAFLELKVGSRDGVKWIANSIDEVAIFDDGVKISGSAFPRQSA